MRKNEYSVPKAVYYQCIWLIKDIDRLRKLEAVSNYAARDDELVFFMDDEEVIRDAEVLEKAKWRLNCIRKALIKIPAEYRQSTLDCKAIMCLTATWLMRIPGANGDRY